MLMPLAMAAIFLTISIRENSITTRFGPVYRVNCPLRTLLTGMQSLAHQLQMILRMSRDDVGQGPHRHALSVGEPGSSFRLGRDRADQRDGRSTNVFELDHQVVTDAGVEVSGGDVIVLLEAVQFVLIAAGEAQH